MDHKLDNIDRKIIEMLQKNARTPVKEIAKEVFLSSPAVSARIEHLEKTGLITGYHAQVNPVFLGSHIKAFINLLPIHSGNSQRHRMQLRHRRLLHAHRSRLPLNYGAGPLHQRTAAIRPHKNADRILHQCRTQRPAGGVKPHRQIFSLFKAEKMRGGKHSKLRSPFFPLALPLSGHANCCRLWRCVQVLAGRWMLRYWI